mgnify:FL=1
MKTNQLYSVIGKVECYILQVINHVVYCMYQEQAKGCSTIGWLFDVITTLFC